MHRCERDRAAADGHTLAQARAPQARAPCVSLVCRAPVMSTQPHARCAPHCVPQRGLADTLRVGAAAEHTAPLQRSEARCDGAVMALRVPSITSPPDVPVRVIYLLLLFSDAVYFTL